MGHGYLSGLCVWLWEPGVPSPTYLRSVSAPSPMQPGSFIPPPGYYQQPWQQQPTAPTHQTLATGGLVCSIISIMLA